jgi:hypothetical protein
MDILRARPTRRCVYLLVRCPCGRQFGHPARRRLIVCYWCGRIVDAAQRRRTPFASPRGASAGRLRILLAAARAEAASRASRAVGPMPPRPFTMSSRTARLVPGQPRDRQAV